MFEDEVEGIRLSKNDGFDVAVGCEEGVFDVEGKVNVGAAAGGIVPVGEAAGFAAMEAGAPKENDGVVATAGAGGSTGVLALPNENAGVTLADVDAEAADGD